MNDGLSMHKDLRCGRERTCMIFVSLVGTLPKAEWQCSRSDTMLVAGHTGNLSVVMPGAIPWNR
jgi:hypothetical protein